MIRIVFLTTVLSLILMASAVSAETFNWYFSDDDAGNAAGDDTTGDGSRDRPWKSINKAESIIATKSLSDVCNLYFDREDMWTEETGQTYHHFLIPSDGPIVNIDAYGTGSRPVFDGSITDFATAPDDISIDPDSTYRRWYSFFNVQRTHCSMSNVEIKNVYGQAILLYGADNFTLSKSTIHNFGGSAVQTRYQDGIENCVVEHSKIYNGQQLYKFGKRTGWGAAISFTASGYGNDGLCKDNIVRNNVVYDIYGEGINAPNSLVEYNIVGDTGSIGINTSSHDFDSLTTVVRYNFVIMSDWSTSDYDGLNGSGPHGIRIYDEEIGGDNSAADISIYGNVIVNRRTGIWFFCNRECNNPFGSVKIYNNLIIDSNAENIRVSNPEEATVSYVHNNSSIRYDTTGRHTTAVSDAGWTISHNAFYPENESNAVGAGWTLNYITDDPGLPGEPAIDWTVQSGATYFSDIVFDTHLYPNSDSPLINSGIALPGFDESFLTYGSDWGDLPDMATFNTVRQTDHGSWDIGAAIFSFSDGGDADIGEEDADIDGGDAHADGGVREDADTGGGEDADGGGSEDADIGEEPLNDDSGETGGCQCGVGDHGQGVARALSLLSLGSVMKNSR